MKEIRVFVTHEHRVSTTPTNLTQGIDLIGLARLNKLKVVEGALSVEHALAQRQPGVRDRPRV